MVEGQYQGPMSGVAWVGCICPLVGTEKECLIEGQLCSIATVTAVGIHTVDDEGNKHYHEFTVDDTKEYGRWTQTVTKIEILRKERT